MKASLGGKHSDDMIEYVAADVHRVSMCVLQTGNPDAPILLCLPAMGVAASYYAGFCEVLRESGGRAVNRVAGAAFVFFGAALATAER